MKIQTLMIFWCCVLTIYVFDSAWGVPWPTWDGVGGDELMDEMDMLGLVGYLCKHYYDDDLPEGVCQGKLEGKMGMTTKH